MADAAGIVQFVTAQLDADEAVALAAAKDARAAEHRDGTHWRMSDEGLYCEWAPIACGPYGYLGDDVGTHMARWDPARVLAEVAAKRRRLALHQPEQHLISGRALLYCTVCLSSRAGQMSDDWTPDAWPCETILLDAAPYAGRPGWRDEWAIA